MNRLPHSSSLLFFLGLGYTWEDISQFKQQGIIPWLKETRKWALLLDDYPKEQAVTLEPLDFAIAGFHEMKMQPSVGGGGKLCLPPLTATEIT